MNPHPSNGLFIARMITHFIMETGLTREEAERLVKMYEGRGHKQLYWAEAEED